MSERISAPDGFEDKINEALKNKEPCPAQVEHPLHDGETMAVYCDIGLIVNCEHKGPRRRFYEGDLCEVNEHYTCLYNPGGEDKQPPEQKLRRYKSTFCLAGLTEEELKKYFGVKSFEEYISLRVLNFIRVHAEEIVKQAIEDDEAEVPKAPLFDDFMNELEKECGEEHKKIYQRCRNIFYRSSLPNLMEIVPPKIEEGRNRALFNYYKEFMKDDEKNDK
ncbi:hypothetical protein KY342_06420 [Candidatus Woesearchaeota archaeon]|nr:hypothetical protein [Candidatus Woesearchaeota archaeon]